MRKFAACDGVTNKFRVDVAAMARILLVDDQESNLLALQTTLRKPGRELVCVRRGQDAVAEVRIGSFVAAVLDVAMPGMDGVTTARALRLIEPTLPILFVTALADDGKVARSLQRVNGARVFLKPFDPKLLDQCVAEFEGQRAPAG